MKLAALFVLASVCAAQAQTYKPPVTIQLNAKSNGERVGTATVSGNRVYLHNAGGDFLGTIEHGKDGTRTFYNPNGKVVHQTKK